MEGHAVLDLTIRDFDGEPRMRDLQIAEALEFEHPRRIRSLIQRHMETLCGFADIVAQRVTVNHGGSPHEEYWLTEHQALFLCTRSEARGAVALTRQMVMVFAAWRRGHVAAPDSQADTKMDLPPDAYIWRGLIREARLLFGRDRARWLWHQSPLPQPPAFLRETGTPPTDPEAIVLQFMRARFEVTGRKSDFVTSREVLDAFAEWALPLGHVLGECATSRAMRAVALGYRDPDTGCGFAPHKRSVQGYIGLRPRPPE